MAHHQNVDKDPDFTPGWLMIQSLAPRILLGKQGVGMRKPERRPAVRFSPTHLWRLLRRSVRYYKRAPPLLTDPKSDPSDSTDLGLVNLSC